MQRQPEHMLLAYTHISAFRFSRNLFTLVKGSALTTAAGLSFQLQ
jgi:hypothetical protein